MINQIILGDCTKMLFEMPENFVDLGITSPPFNVGVSYKSSKNDLVSVDEYCAFAAEVMTGMFRVLKDGGRFCLEIGGSGRDLPLSWLWQDAAYKAGFKLHTEIVIDHRATNPTAWGSWLKSDNVRVIPNFRHLYVFYKGTSTKRGAVPCDISRDEFVEWTKGRWQINWSKGANKKEHPAKFPEELPTRCMKLFGHPGDLVLDPFIGSGTTAVVACKLGRNYLGIELSPDYYAIAVNKVEKVKQKLGQSNK